MRLSIQWHQHQLCTLNWVLQSIGRRGNLPSNADFVYIQRAGYSAPLPLSGGFTSCRQLRATLKMQDQEHPGRAETGPPSPPPRPPAGASGRAPRLPGQTSKPSSNLPRSRPPVLGGWIVHKPCIHPPSHTSR